MNQSNQRKEFKTATSTYNFHFKTLGEKLNFCKIACWECFLNKLKILRLKETWKMILGKKLNFKIDFWRCHHHMFGISTNRSSEATLIQFQLPIEEVTLAFNITGTHSNFLAWILFTSILFHFDLRKRNESVKNQLASGWTTTDFLDR